MAQLTIAPEEETLAGVAAERLAVLVAAAAQERGSAFVALTGGQTPRRLYQRLADARERWRTQIPWDRVYLFWSDERNVPPYHGESNYGMARDTLIAHVPIPADRVHRIRGECPAADAARKYERGLIETFRAESRQDTAFDLMLLGLGADAHIASIFPASPVLEEQIRRVAAPWVPQVNAFRITLTPPALLNADRIVMLVSGESKAAAVAAAIEAPDDVRRWPAQLLRAAGDRVEWLIDEAAARALSSPRA